MLKLKMLRNTIFTILVLVLTAYGLQWHHRIAKSQSSVTSASTILAGQIFNSTVPDFPLSINFNSPEVRLGQSEAVTISTLPNAQLEVVTQYPDGSVEHPASFTGPADSNGNRAFTVTISDFHNLGLVRISVVATVGTKTTEAIGQYQVIPWEVPSSLRNGGYTFPLVP